MLRPVDIREVADCLGLQEEHLSLHGRCRAMVDLALLREEPAPCSKNALVSAGYGSLPICMAKTHLSLSHDLALRGAPSGYTFPIKGMRLVAGAGYVYALAGDIMTMPGLPSHPRATQIDVDDAGKITDLF